MGKKEEYKLKNEQFLQNLRTEKDGDKEDHQRIRRPYRRQCIRTDALPYNQRIGYVIALLQQRTRHHRQGETQQRTRYATPGKVSVP